MRQRRPTGLPDPPYRRHAARDDDNRPSVDVPLDKILAY
jgi:hypothetical protein